MKRRIFILAILCSLAASPAHPQERVDLAAVHRIRTEAFENSNVMEHLFYLTDVHGPRLTGSPQLRAAGEWVVQQLNQMGAANARLEKWGPFGRGWSYSYFSAHLQEPGYSSLIGFPLAWTPGTNGRISGELVIAPIEKEEDFEKYRGKLTGKIVLLGIPREVAQETEAASRRYSDKELEEITDTRIPSPKALFDFPKREPERDWESMRRFRRKRNEFLVKEGVLAVLTPGMGSLQSSSHRSQSGTVFAAAGGSQRPEEPVPPPMAAITPEHYNRIARLVARKLPVKIALEIDARFYDQDKDSFTVVGEIPGKRKPDEVVMVGGHLDSWHGGTGATDNAAGCAVALEVMRILKSLNLEMDRTVRLALWTGEEQGLLGSKAYVKEHFADPEVMAPKPEHAKLAAYFNHDNGGGKVRGIYAQDNLMVVPIFKAWLEPFQDLGADTVSLRNTSGTDHLSFNDVGLPGFQFIQDPLEYGTRTHHSNMDVYDRIPATDLMQSAAIMASFVYNAATRAEMLPRKPLPKPKPKRERGPGEAKGTPAPSDQ